MKTCNNNHEEISFESEKCPLCIANEKIVALQYEIDCLEDTSELDEDFDEDDFEDIDEDFDEDEIIDDDEIDDIDEDDEDEEK